MNQRIYTNPTKPIYYQKQCFSCGIGLAHKNRNKNIDIKDKANGGIV